MNYKSFTDEIEKLAIESNVLKAIRNLLGQSSNLSNKKFKQLERIRDLGKILVDKSKKELEIKFGGTNEIEIQNAINTHNHFIGKTVPSNFVKELRSVLEKKSGLKQTLGRLLLGTTLATSPVVAQKAVKAVQDTSKITAIADTVKKFDITKPPLIDYRNDATFQTLLKSMSEQMGNVKKQVFPKDTLKLKK